MTCLVSKRMYSSWEIEWRPQNNYWSQTETNQTETSPTIKPKQCLQTNFGSIVTSLVSKVSTQAEKFNGDHITIIGATLKSNKTKPEPKILIKPWFQSNFGSNQIKAKLNNEYIQKL